ncbi:hypothetical protein F5X97DRAFT_324475 [Nemania serpens]|nr:hypothetical protein F5X97DRAFT_324475 [Nemania serpens]
MGRQCSYTPGCKEVVPWNRLMCEKHLAMKREYNRRNNARRNALSECPYCGGAKDRATTRCSSCTTANLLRCRELQKAEKVLLSLHPDNQNRIQRTKAQLERDRERRRAVKQVRKDAGLCVNCGVHPPASQRLRCLPCLEKKREKSRVYHARRRRRLTEAASMMLELEPDILNTTETDGQRLENGKRSSRADSPSFENSPGPDDLNLSLTESLAEEKSPTQRSDSPPGEVPRPDWRQYAWE